MYYSFKSQIETLRNNIDNNPEFRKVLGLMEKANSQISIMKDSGKYTKAGIDQATKDYRTMINQAKDEAYLEKANQAQEKANKIKEKYKPKELSDSEVNRKLLELKQFENKLKFAGDEELGKMYQNYWNNESDLDYDKLNILGSELKSRGNFSTADHLSVVMTEQNILEPWKNDLEYKAAEKERAEAAGEIGATGISVKDENGNYEIVDINDIS